MCSGKNATLEQIHDEMKQFHNESICNLMFITDYIQDMNLQNSWSIKFGNKSMKFVL